MPDANMSLIAGQWLAARDNIATTLIDLLPMRPEAAKLNAAAIIARLADHKPPILLQFATEKE